MRRISLAVAALLSCVPPLPPALSDAELARRAGAARSFGGCEVRVDRKARDLGWWTVTACEREFVCRPRPEDPARASCEETTYSYERGVERAARLVLARQSRCAPEAVEVISGLSTWYFWSRDHGPTVARDPADRTLRAVACGTWYVCSIGEAVQSCTRRDPSAYEENERRSRPHIAKARDAFAAERFAEAEAHARSALEIHGDALVAHGIIGLLACRRGDVAKARAAAVRLPPSRRELLRSICDQQGVRY